MKSKYNILYLDHGVKLLGGGQINTLSLIKSMNRAIFTPITVSSIENVFTAELRTIGVRVELLHYPGILTSTYRRNVKFNPFTLAAYAVSVITLVFRLYRFIKVNNIDLIHPCDNISRIAGGIAAKMAGVPAVCQITDDFEDTFPNRVLRGLILWSMVSVMPVSDTVGSFFRVTGKAAVKVKTVYTGIDIDYFDLSGPQSSLRVEFSIKPEEIVIGIVGLLQPIKGHRELFQALALLVKKDSTPEFRCVVVGDGPELESLRQLASDLGILKRIIFIGFRKDISNLMKGMDMLVAPSRSEASSRVLLEAGALKLPVIGTKVGGIPEMIDENRTGFLVPLDDIPALAGAIEKLFTPDLRRKMGEQARIRVERSFSNRKITGIIENMYLAALRNPQTVKP